MSHDRYHIDTLLISFNPTLVFRRTMTSDIIARLPDSDCIVVIIITFMVTWLCNYFSDYVMMPDYLTLACRSEPLHRSSQSLCSDHRLWKLPDDKYHIIELHFFFLFESQQMINLILLSLCQDNLSSHLVSSQGGKWWWNLKFQLAIISPDLERDT